MDNPQIAKAVLIPMEGQQPSSNQDEYILVQFNPASLKVSLSNTLKTETQGGDSSSASQYVDKSESSLAVSLLFDTTIARKDERSFDVMASATEGAEPTAAPHTAKAEHEANSDVRLQTQKIAKAFMEPQASDSDNPRAPKRCRFQWGSFSFDGMLSSYSETLDYFSPEGIPLRATLQLSFKEERFQFDTLSVSAGSRNGLSLSPGGPDISAADANLSQGKDPKNWRDTALFNGLENPRISASIGLSVPGVSLQVSAGVSASASASTAASVGFSAGASSRLGTDIPGAFATIKTG